MKVYYRLEGEESLIEYLDDDFSNSVISNILEKWKYKTMWALRSLEDKINQEGGIIIVTTKGIETKNFTEETTEQIGELLSRI